MGVALGRSIGTTVGAVIADAAMGIVYGSGIGTIIGIILE